MRTGGLRGSDRVRSSRLAGPSGERWSGKARARTFSGTRMPLARVVGGLSLRAGAGKWRTRLTTVIVASSSPKVKRTGKKARSLELNMNMKRTLSRSDGNSRSPSEEVEEEESTKTVTIQAGSPAAAGSTASSGKVLFRKVVRRLANLNFAIGEIAFLAFLSALGTIVEQNKAPEYYTSQLIEGNPLLSDILGNVVLLLGFDHMYNSPVYLGMGALLTASLMACSYQTQWPMVKVAQRWRFMEDPARIATLSSSHAVPLRGGPGSGPGTSVASLDSALRAEGYETFVKPKERGHVLYAFKGLSGKFAPIGVHVSMVLIVLGATISATCGWHGTVMIQEGNESPVRESMRPATWLGTLGKNQPWMGPDEDSEEGISLRLNKFKIDYYPDGKVEQFYSDLSVTGGAQGAIAGGGDGALFTKLISVNDPLRFGSLTAYQTDWGVSGAKVSVSGSALVGEGEVGEGGSLASAQSQEETFLVPLVSLEGRLGPTGGRIWGGVLPLPDKSLVTVVARDLQNVAVYGPDGRFMGIRRPGSNKDLEVGSFRLKVADLVATSGLELKSDPGVPVVYTGFAFLMLTTVLSYVSHSQVWAATGEAEDMVEGSAQEGGVQARLVVGGKTNRAKKEFENELAAVMSKALF